jgi:hypothetical protein
MYVYLTITLSYIKIVNIIFIIAVFQLGDNREISEIYAVFFVKKDSF